MQHAELRCKGGVGSKVGWSKALNKTVDYRVDSQVKVGMRERGFKEEGIRERWRPREGRSQGAKGKRDKQNESTRQDRELWWGEPLAMGRGAWDELVGRGTRSQLAQDRVNGRTN